MASSTTLVRDGDSESYEDPDSAPTTHEVEIEPSPGSETAVGTLRAHCDDPGTVPGNTQIADARRGSTPGCSGHAATPQ